MAEKPQSKKARFFCEYCDTEVPEEAKFCPKCGRFFASVRCPACGFTGEHFLFTNGCPSCGYAMSGPIPEKKAIKQSIKNNNKSLKKDKKSFTTIEKKKRQGDDSLPSWIYVLSMVLLAIILYLFIDFR